MRALLVIAGMIVGAPTFIFFSIGSQTFIRKDEQLMAAAMAPLSGLLLVFSFILIFYRSIMPVQFMFLVGVILASGIIISNSG
jgi:hypothetical protein